MMKFISSLMSRLLHAYADSKTNSNSSEEATIKSVPREVFTEILAKVASASLADHFNANQSCKLFHEAGCDNLIFQHASVEELPITQWYPKPEVSTFLKQCEEAQNPEVLYRQEDVLGGKQLLTQKSRCMGKRSRSGEIEECRKKAKKSIGGMWIPPAIKMVIEMLTSHALKAQMPEQIWESNMFRLLQYT
ncbi:uncharacterized protein LOC113306420 [Papaver somniferum]|uniref:uncharacterized protein LOC113306420 n=1 Tax=Papaver somniferum TaxID=3469 RepID=UPI000E6F4A9E|nr:uncharacterized protein LOC113306420 [Papaver somniferum]